jgi:two-component system sensor histidine kinase ChvG
LLLTLSIAFAMWPERSLPSATPALVVARGVATGVTTGAALDPPAPTEPTARDEPPQLAGMTRVVIDDQGPGIPPGKEKDIFRRFYTERPAGEKFGTHSGLGLSISKLIVEAMGGTIHAENLRRADGSVAGARFVVRLQRSA